MIKNTGTKLPKGFWFYGLSGSGKSYASIVLGSFINDSFIIDGDVVRKHISTDLGFSNEDRVKQITRIYGIAQLCLENSKCPIISSVLMSEELLKKCVEDRIFVIKIERAFEQLKQVRDLYDGEKNVVGVDLPLADLDVPTLINDGTPNFKKALIEYVKTISY